MSGKMMTPERFNQLTDKFPGLDPIVVIGDVGVDKYTYGMVSRISPEAPVPVLEVVKEWLQLGMAANISNNLKSLGINSTLCGVVGDDNNADSLEKMLAEIDLKTIGIVRSNGRSTVFKERVMTEVQQICRIDYESVDDIDYKTQQELLEKMRGFHLNHGAIILEDYGKGTLNKELIGVLIETFKGSNKFITVDPSRNTDPLFYKGVTLLKPNLFEAKLMVQALGYREKDLQRMAQILVEKLDLTMLVITLGNEGMALIDRREGDNLILIPTVASEVFDVSGAGDTAIGLITAGLLAGGTLEEAAWLGNCGAGVVVGKHGTATVSIKELQEFHNKIQKKYAQ